MQMTKKATVWLVSAFMIALALVASKALNHPLIMVIIPLLIPAAWLVFRFPIWVCLGFIVFSFFRIHEAVPALLPLRIPQLLALASFAVLGWHLFISNTIKVYWNSHFSLVIFFFLLVCFGAMFATDRGEAIATIQGSYSKIIIMVIAIAWLVRSPADFALATRFILVSGMLIAGIAISNKLNGIGLVEGTRVTIGRNIGSMIGDPNDLSLVLTFPLSFAASEVFSRHNKGWKRLFPVVAYIMISWAIIATQSRGGLLGMSAVTASILWRVVQNKAFVISAGAAMLFVLVAAAGISDRSSGGAAEEGIDASAMGRIYAWQAAMAMAVHHPITGVGINNFYANYYFYSPHWDGKNHAVHSTWFQILAETGFVGLIVFVTLVATTFALNIKAITMIKQSNAPPAIEKANNALLSGLIGFCISGTFLTQGFIWPFYILFALSVALIEYLKNTQGKTHE